MCASRVQHVWTNEENLERKENVLVLRAGEARCVLHNISVKQLCNHSQGRA